MKFILRIQSLYLFISLIVNFAHAKHQTSAICDNFDKRIKSDYPQMGRMMVHSKGIMACSGTLISKNCMISAGHCVDFANEVHFNVPLSNINGDHNLPVNNDIYLLDQIIDKEIKNEGEDWLVFKLQKNQETGLDAGEAQGFLNISDNLDVINRRIFISGYGIDYDRPMKHLTQQTSYGKILKQVGPLIIHDLDTIGGVSGGALIDQETLKIIGVHTHGGCESKLNKNKANFIKNSPNFLKAIHQCLNN